MTPPLCPFCQKILNEVTNLSSENKPYPNAFTVCYYCARILVFNDDMTLRRPTTEDEARLVEIPARLKAIRIVQDTIVERWMHDAKRN